MEEDLEYVDGVRRKLEQEIQKMEELRTLYDQRDDFNRVEEFDEILKQLRD